MFLFKKLLSSWLLPPLGLVLLALVALVFLGRKRRGVIVCCIALGLTLALSLPCVADWLSRSLETELDNAPISAAALKTVQAIVVLGGGVHRGAPEYGGDTLSKYSLERVRYAANLARKSQLPLLTMGGLSTADTRRES
jgi:uncharacterized SAM-binding protein YcdF (DUF218 family)